MIELKSLQYLSFVTVLLEFVRKNSLRYLYEERPKVSNYVTEKGLGGKEECREETSDHQV